MANQEHLDLLTQGVGTWNQWREEYRSIRPDLSEADLAEAELSGFDLTRTILRDADLRYANLSDANLSDANLINVYFHGANLCRADLSGADLHRADFSSAKLIQAKLIRARFHRADLYYADLSGADLSEADLTGAEMIAANLVGATLHKAQLIRTDLTGANLSSAHLNKANLTRANLVETKLIEADLTSCKVYGISAWNVELEGAIQNNLVITRKDEPTITVDNLKIAQFIYLLLNNQEIRDVIDTIAKKAVLILGRFTPERKAILDAIRENLRTHKYLPILFDFDKPASRNLTETVSTLAHLARFIIADITDAKSIPQELMMIVPNLPSVAVQPLILKSQHEYDMFEHFTRFPWVLPVYHYTDQANLLQSIQEKVIIPAEQKAKELEQR